MLSAPSTILLVFATPLRAPVIEDRPWRQCITESSIIFSAVYSGVAVTADNERTKLPDLLSLIADIAQYSAAFIVCLRKSTCCYSCAVYIILSAEAFTGNSPVENWERLPGRPRTTSRRFTVAQVESFLVATGDRFDQCDGQEYFSQGRKRRVKDIQCRGVTLGPHLTITITLRIGHGEHNIT